jgi:hypothetical protein
MMRRKEKEEDHNFEGEKTKPSKDEPTVLQSIEDS